MKSTGVKYSYKGGVGTTSQEMVPAGVACRLLSVQFEQLDVSGTDYPVLEFRTASDSGALKLKFQFNTRVYMPQVLNIPSHGIYFEDGIFCKPPSPEGIESITITYQG